MRATSAEISAYTISRRPVAGLDRQRKSKRTLAAGLISGLNAMRLAGEHHEENRSEFWGRCHFRPVCCHDLRVRAGQAHQDWWIVPDVRARLLFRSAGQA